MTAAPLHVVQLTAENYKRITAVDITPTPGDPTVVIGGRNAQGKSSVLDALWSAIRGTDAAKGTGTTRPIHEGADTATVRVDLGELIVTRTWRGDKSTLTVTSAEGARYSSPQKMLDDLVGAVSFDPLAFTRAPARQQAADLADLAGLGDLLTETSAQRAAAFEERTEVGRTLKRAEANLSSVLERIAGRDLPDEPVDVAALVERSNSLRHELELRATREDRARALAALRDDLAARLAEAEREATLAAQEVADEPTVTHADVAAVEEQIATSQAADHLYQLGLDLARAQEEVDESGGRRDDLTAQINALDSTLRRRIAAAEFPVPGLGITAEGVVNLKGVPFSQASAAEQLRVSVGMAMAANPRLRVVRIADGSLLDDESMAMVAAMAAEGGFQVWIERVGDPGEVGVLIEDGQVVDRIG